MDPTYEEPSLRLCLDFSNTIDWRNGKHGKTPGDKLTSYRDLVGWTKDQDLIDGEEASLLERLARDSGSAETIFKRAVELREAIYRVFSAVADKNRRPDERDLEVLNGFISESMAQSKVVRTTGKRFEWACYCPRDAPDGVLWPIAKSAADLLTSERLRDVRECANRYEGCGWLFLDDSKSHSRVWCDMGSCGNTAKARRYQKRHKEDSA